MMNPGFYPHPVASVGRRETHISTVFLTGAFVYKIKKPVDLGFLDFTTLEKRMHYCRQEITLNRRLSDMVYIDMIPITLQGDRYGLDGPGETVEYTVKMHQLSETDSIRQRLQSGTLNDGHVEELVRLLTGFYALAPKRRETDPPASLAWEENLQLAERFAGRWIDRRQFEFVRTASRSFFRRHQRLFHRRRMEGKIKDGHGDLRTDHIYFTKKGIQIIDCIEFNDRLRVLDIISDLAFLVMDLEYNRFPQTARSLIRWYLKQTGDMGALSLLAFYCCYRAMVRCKVSCFSIRKYGSRRADPGMIAAAGRYLTMAHEYAAAFNRPFLWICCGLPGSGKSTIARTLASVLDADVIGSDVIRKQLFAGSFGPAAGGAYQDGMYSAYATGITYERLFALAREDLKKGNSIIIDATFSRASRRTQAVRMAASLEAMPVFVECGAKEPTLAARLLKRETRPSVSDARLIHLEAFKKRFEPLSRIADAIYIPVDTENSPAVCLGHILMTDSLMDGFTRKGGEHV
ncbi:hypothetical protein DSCA_13310 [Desulfosarcina alkanivorans]|uniref:Aminoglycoside phosphotransferase domain-containing protein n=2 Tax=Desulfosarcina alkanivorans TaxID=571177 RepID=A0A5K7YKQ3_9BACT|nr:hypothetical protein DSCA_13310 [Desulfosarcina alkanivorans]